MESEAAEPGIGQILTGNGLFLLHGSDLFRKYIFLLGVSYECTVPRFAM